MVMKANTKHAPQATATEQIFSVTKAITKVINEATLLLKKTTPVCRYCIM